MWVKLTLIALLLIPTHALANWQQLAEGQSLELVKKHVGEPLIKTVAKKRAMETWNFDNGAYVIFYHNKLIQWQAPKSNLKNR